MNLSPYAKTVVSAVGAFIIVLVQFLTGDGTTDPTTLVTALVALLTTFGVFKATNTPVIKSSPLEPSVHDVTEYSRPESVQTLVALANRPTSKPVRAKKRTTAKKTTAKTVAKGE